jgi:leucyl-tRNA synthetase
MGVCATEQGETAMTAPKFFITTAISYPNGAPHIGHAYEALATDALARFKRLDGFDVYFLTGTDEHGIKMAQQAAREGLTPRELADRNVVYFQKMVAMLGCTHDRFIRTTDPDHYRASAEIWRRMVASGDIYKDRYATACATDRRARRSNGWRRRAIFSSSPPIRTGCSPGTMRIRKRWGRRNGGTRSSASSRAG